MNANEILKTRANYMSFKAQLAKSKKAITITQEHKHISGITIKSTATVKAWFDLNDNMARINTAVISKLTNKDSDLTKDWLKLNVQSQDRYKHISLEEYINLPDWDESLEKLECEIIK